MVGQPCAEYAISKGHRVRGMGRDPAKVPASLREKLEGFVTSSGIYDIPALDKAVSGVDAIVCAYGFSPEVVLEGQLLLLRAAERAGVKVGVDSPAIRNAIAANYSNEKILMSVCRSIMLLHGMQTGLWDTWDSMSPTTLSSPSPPKYESALASSRFTCSRGSSPSGFSRAVVTRFGTKKQRPCRTSETARKNGSVPRPTT